MSTARMLESVAATGEADLPDRRRADLQGLRAIAVLAVIAFHFGIPGVPGGFVGVDIFFVLSGFFITRLIMRDVESHGRIRLARFWASRIKRLLPNGLLVILAVLAASALLLPSYRLPSIYEDAISAAAFLANFHFAAQTIDYFNLDNPPSPLLHYWSLAVEEQFYLALPLLMTGAVLVVPAADKRKAVLALLAAVVAVSLAASLVVIEHSQPAAFFHPHLRAWQLALGGLVGVLFAERGKLPRALRAAGALLGAAVVIASLAMLDDSLPYPGIRALAPTLGTALLILGLDAGGASAGLARLLSFRPVVWIGDLSYSLYLWHWPVAVFLAALWPDAGATVMLAGLATTLLLAASAYYAVERPIHRMKLGVLGLPRTFAVGFGSVAVVAMAAGGAGALPGRSDPAVTARITAAAADLGPNYQNGCHRNFDDVDQPDCRFGRLGGPRVVLFGDSHAAQWFTAVVKAGETTGWEVNAWTKTGCPSMDVTIWYPPTRSVYGACDRWREERLRALLKTPPQLVILANFSHYYGWIYDEARKRAADRPSTEMLWRDGAGRTIETLIAAGISVVELNDTPRMYVGYKDCLSAGRWSACVRPRGEALAGIPLPGNGSILYTRLDLSDVLCSALVCPAVIDGAIAYRDSDHLTASHAATLHAHFSALLASRKAAD